MNAIEFVDAIRTEVRDAAVHDVISLLIQPPGRRPDPKLVALSQWFNALPTDDKERVHEIARMASNQATFGALAVLDGVRAIENGENRGTLELRHVKDGQSTLLNSSDGPLLHDLLQME